MRITGEALRRLQFAAEVGEVFLGQPAFQVGPGVGSGRGVPLKIDKISAKLIGPRAPEVIESHFREGGGRRKCRNMASDARFSTVAAHDHRHRVPAHDAFDAPFDLPAAGHGRLGRVMDCVHIGRVDRKRQGDARALGAQLQLLQNLLGLFHGAVSQDIVERTEPLLDLDIIQFGGRLIDTVLVHAISFGFVYIDGDWTVDGLRGALNEMLLYYALFNYASTFCATKCHFCVV